MAIIYRKKGKNRVGEKVEVYITRSRARGSDFARRGVRYIYTIEGSIAGFAFDAPEYTTNKRKAITIANRMLKRLEKTTVSFKKDIEPHLV